MLKSLGIAFLFFASSNLGSQTRGNDCEDNDDDNNATPATDTPNSCKYSLHDLNISSPSVETVIGGKVILECYSKASCLPTNFTLFLNNKTVGQIIKGKAMEQIVFNYTISSRSDLGEYKCKARNRYNNVVKSKYSKGFNFTLKATEEEKNKLIVFIVAPLILLLLLLTSVIAFHFLILPWYKSKKRKSASKSTSYVPDNYASSGNCGTYDNAFRTEYGKDGHIEYCEVKMKNKREDCRKEMLNEDTAVTYAEIMIRR